MANPLVSIIARHCDYDYDDDEISLMQICLGSTQFCSLFHHKRLNSMEQTLLISPNISTKIARQAKLRTFSDRAKQLECR